MSPMVSLNSSFILFPKESVTLILLASHHLFKKLIKPVGVGVVLGYMGTGSSFGNTKGGALCRGLGSTHPT